MNEKVVLEFEFFSILIPVVTYSQISLSTRIVEFDVLQHVINSSTQMTNMIARTRSTTNMNLRIRISVHMYIHTYMCIVCQLKYSGTMKSS